jgi:hypothetical protein
MFSNYVDVRLAGKTRYHLTPPSDINMRVPDNVRKCVLFVGEPRIPDPHFGGTAFVVSVRGELGNDFQFLVTARHVAEEIEGQDFVLRCNKKDGTPVVLEGHPDTRWYYHPTERSSVDAAVTLYAPEVYSELDVMSIPVDGFLTDQTIAEKQIGSGDEVFITGLFTKLTQTTKNLPIVRMGNIALIPGEKIPFGDSGLIDAYLIEARSIGGLSGSPVFVRETINIPVVDTPGSPNWKPGRHLHGGGAFHFLGSTIGHWDLPPNKNFRVHSESVNMGVSLVVPASKILEILNQKEIKDLMKQAAEEIRKERSSGATLDSGKKDESFTKQDFEKALKKVTRKRH